MATRVDLKDSSQPLTSLASIECTLDPEVADALKVATKILGRDLNSICVGAGAGAGAGSPPLSARASSSVETAFLSLGGSPAHSIISPKSTRPASPSFSPQTTSCAGDALAPRGVGAGAGSPPLSARASSSAEIDTLSLGGGPAASAGAAGAEILHENKSSTSASKAKAAFVPGAAQKPVVATDPIRDALNTIEEISKTLVYRAPEDPDNPGHALPLAKRISVFPYREIQRSLTYFAKPKDLPQEARVVKELTRGTPAGKFIEYSEMCLKEEVSILRKKYDKLCLKLVDLLNDLATALYTETQREKPSIETIKKLWADVRSSWQELLCTYKSGREMGLSEDLAHFFARLERAPDENVFNKLRRKYSDVSVIGIEFPNPFSQEVLLVDKRSKTWGIEFDELEGFLLEYRRLLENNVSYLTQLVQVIKSVRVVMDRYFGQGVMAIYPGMVLPPSLKLLKPT